MDIRLLLHPSPSYGTAGYTGSGISCVLSTVTFKVMLVLPPPAGIVSDMLTARYRNQSCARFGSIRCTFITGVYPRSTLTALLCVRAGDWKLAVGGP